MHNRREHETQTPHLHIKASFVQISPLYFHTQPPSMYRRQGPPFQPPAQSLNPFFMPLQQPQPPPFLNPFFAQPTQLSLFLAPINTMPQQPWDGSFNGHGFYGRRMPQQHPNHGQHHGHQPSSGPHRYQRGRFRQEPQYSYQGMGGMAQHPHYQHHAPLASSGPRHNQRERFRQAEPQTNHFLHESFGAVRGDRSTGFNPGMARIDARNNTGAGTVRRTPTKN